MATVVITGAGRGLGRASAVRLAKDGHRIVALDLDGATAQQAADDVGGIGFSCDVSDRRSVFAVAEQVGPTDILVNNAGIWYFTSILDMSEDQARRVLDVQLLGMVWCIQAFGRDMPDGGSIINTSSAAAAMAMPGCGLYPAAKGAIEVMTRQLAQELAPRKIRVNAVAPGGTVTEGTSSFIVDDAAHGAAIPLGRVGHPSDIADAIAFLASDEARYITGQVLHVDGGVSAGGRRAPDDPAPGGAR